MGFPEEIKRIRQRCFLTQRDFAKEVQVAFSTVNRWEKGRSFPSYVAQTRFEELCKENNIVFSEINVGGN